MSKGSSRRIENRKSIEKHIALIDWSKRDKKKDAFLVRVNGRVVKND
tara:strand:- start:1180 stop:1320 length:141 start_codon:yes stop_codon:yes gene_type:complete